MAGRAEEGRKWRQETEAATIKTTTSSGSTDDDDAGSVSDGTLVSIGVQFSWWCWGEWQKSYRMCRTVPHATCHALRCCFCGLFIRLICAAILFTNCCQNAKSCALRPPLPQSTEICGISVYVYVRQRPPNLLCPVWQTQAGRRQAGGRSCGNLLARRCSHNSNSGPQVAEWGVANRGMGKTHYNALLISLSFSLVLAKSAES